jgi:tRNA nucleotidyltransferase (CCA-adding enzyme)
VAERLELPAEVVEIAATLERAGYDTWAVGGALRDLLLGIDQTDVDLATAAPPEAVRKLFPRTVAVGLKYGTVGVLDHRRRLHEVTTFRRDVETDGRHAVVVFGASLTEDLARRDFTINALAYHPLRHEWADPFGGRQDLAARVIRAVGEPADRFREDYLRILRMVRFSARFGFAIDPGTWAAAVAAAPGLAGLSAERVRDEWFKGLMTAGSVAHLAGLWRAVGAAAVWLPGLRDPVPGADIRPAERDPVVLTALMCRDPARVLARLRASNAEQARARALAAGPEAPASLDAPALRRWLHAVGPAADDLLLLARYREGVPPEWAAPVAAIRARGEATARAGLAVTGDDLLALGIPAGPAVGKALDRLLDMVLDDPALNTRERLLEAARAWR